jgi:phage tail-like protein
MTTYRLLINGRPVARFAEAKIQGTYKVPDVTLKRGIVSGTSTLAGWIQDANGRSANPKHHVVLQTIDGSGRPVASYSLVNSWVTKYKGPPLNGKGNDVAIEELEISPTGLEISRP